MAGTSMSGIRLANITIVILGLSVRLANGEGGEGLRACQKLNSTVPFYSTCDTVSTLVPSINVSDVALPFSYTFTGTLAGPGLLVANISATVIGHVRVRVDDHLVVECSSAGASPTECLAAYDIPIPDPHFEANSSRVHVEFVASPGQDAFLQLGYTLTEGATPLTIPAAWFGPVLPVAEAEYLAQKEVAESG